MIGGPLFAEIRDIVDEIFCQLPPPKPSARVEKKPNVAPGLGLVFTPAPTHAPPSMSYYHNCSNG